jgi:UDP-GlcNAc:undecaprenyl-phosphate GlcNAc-1-phosphate transferase
VPFLIAFAVALVATPLCLVAGRAVGLVDRPSGDALKIHARPVPLTGGVAVALAALAGAAASGAMRWWLAASVAAALVVGIVDDARPLPPWVRLAAQAGIGGLLVTGGLRLGPAGLVGAVAVIATVLACTNAVNLMDGQDGLAGGLAAIAGVGLAFLLPGGTAGEALGLATAGAATAFLLWNRPPARIFLGDGGAYVLGTLLAVLAVAVGRGGWPELMAAGACLAVFAVELVTTMVRRLRSDRSVLLGDRDHAYDVAALVLGGRTASTALSWGLGVVSVLVAIPIHASPPGIATVLALTYGGVLVAAQALLRLRIRRLAREDVA